MNINDWLKMRMGLLKHPQFYRNPVMAIWRRALWRLNAQHQPLLKFTTEYGFDVEAKPQDIGVGSLFYRGRYEWGELELWRQLLDRENMVILDIGANFGLYSLFTAAYCHEKGLDGVKIFGFEPNPNECDKFQRNVDINRYSQIQVAQLAISDSTGVCPMAIPSIGMGVFGHLLTEKSTVNSLDEIMEVKTADLDSWCKMYGIEQVDIVKIDVEGHELAVLQGAENLLNCQAIGCILMEVGQGQWREAIEKLRVCGYSIDFVSDDGSLKPLKEEDIGGWNYVLAQANSREEVFVQ